MSDYNCLDLPDHEKVACPGALGGIDSFAILLKGWDEEITDFESEVEWQSAIDAGLAKVVTAGNIKGEVGEPSEVEAENFSPCGAENQLVGHDHEATMRDFGISAANQEFYDKLKQSKPDAWAIGMCDGSMLIVRGRPQFYTSGTPVIPESNREFRHYVVNVHWYVPVSNEGAVQYQKPEGIFEA